MKAGFVSAVIGAMPPANLHVLGVRHHSPACARRVRDGIRRLRPAYVLIEGPADFNPHIDDLRGAHHLPVAIYSFHAEAGCSRASYSPFCDYSPEWLALQTAWETGATPLFCDLPAWHPDFGERANRYADPHGLDTRARTIDENLMQTLGAEGRDALWDTLAEQAEAAELDAVLATYFEGLRPDGIEDPAENGRERFMGQHAAWALREAGGRPVVVVCGGWHGSAIRRHAGEADGTRPLVPLPPEGARVGSYLVPYSYARLDRFTGYAAGMPSPAYYEMVFADGLESAADWAMRNIAQALRQAGQVLSTADFIAWQTHAQALARLRGHRALLRTDLLDAALACIVKEALDVPPAWTEPGKVRHGAEPVLIAMLRALSGERQGQLAAATRLPPLIADVEARLGALDLLPAIKPRSIELDWHQAADRPRAHALHQLRILGQPGIIRRHGPQHTDARELGESFEIYTHPDWLGSLIEASIWGGTLEAAAAARLRARAAEQPGNLGVLAECVSDAAFAGLLGIGGELTDELVASIEACHELAALGTTGLRLVQLYRYGEVFGATLHDNLRPLCASLFERMLWLIEGVGDDTGLAPIRAVQACRDLLRHGDGLQLDGGFAGEVFARRLADPETPPALAGAALGFLLSSPIPAPQAYHPAEHIRRHGLPESLGDFLAGLFALAREEIGAAAETLDAIDDLVGDWPHADFLRALPALRGAFAWFPPRERERLARNILKNAGHSPAEAEIQAFAWMRQGNSLDDQAAAMACEQRVRQRLSRFGLETSTHLTQDDLTQKEKGE